MSSQQILVKRLFGFIFDFSFILCSWVAVNISFSQFFLSLANHLKAFPVFEFEQNFTIFSVLAVFPVCFVGYFTASYYVSNGSSLGKILMGIKFEAKNELTLKNCFLRSCLQLASYACFSIPNLLSFFSNDNRSLIDMMMRTSHLAITPIADLQSQEIDNVLYFPNYEWNFEENPTETDSDEKKAA